jgi:ComF family protein
VLSSLIDILLPNTCPLCGDEPSSEDPDSLSSAINQDRLCSNCAKGFKAITGPICSLCGAPFVTPIGADHLCTGCIKRKRVPFIKARSALYYTEDGSRAIKLFKYNGLFALKPAFDAFLYPLLSQFQDTDLVVPVPLHRRRLRHRGFNQSLILAKLVAKNLNKKVDYKALKRIRLTKPQTELKGEERRKNVRGAFEITLDTLIKGKKVLLIDDVYTTGATITECAQTLKRAGGEVSVLTLARTARV